MIRVESPAFILECLWCGERIDLQESIKVSIPKGMGEEEIKQKLREINWMTLNEEILQEGTLLHGICPDCQKLGYSLSSEGRLCKVG